MDRWEAAHEIEDAMAHLLPDDAPLRLLRLESGALRDDLALLLGNRLRRAEALTGTSRRDAARSRSIAAFVAMRRSSP